MTGETNRPWPAMWALIFGFFMILVDSTIVTVATPTLMRAFGADVAHVVWVTSAYLLAYAVPLLITGRLGDRFGPKQVYLAGLTVFTLASLWCGLTDSLGGLIAARVVQGLGASLMSPQTMAIITRMFPPGDRGRAMGLWGATAGVATLVGPLAGGVLIDALSWQWIFFVNIPFGLAGLALAYRLVPSLETHPHRFDWLGVLLSATGMFCLVFGIQEGPNYGWGTIIGPVTVWGLIGAGVLIFGLFFSWQQRNPGEPLLPPKLLANRNFSLANAAISVMGLGITALPFPLMIWAQQVRGLTPTQAALLTAPTAVVSAVVAPWAGRFVDRTHPAVLASSGLAGMAISTLWMAVLVGGNQSPWLLLFPAAALGFASAFIWAPLSVTATVTLPRELSGAGAGIYNTTRQVGSVVGSAAVAALMQARLAVEPAAVGLGQSLLLPAVAAAAGAAITVWFDRPAHQREATAR